MTEERGREGYGLREGEEGGLRCGGWVGWWGMEDRWCGGGGGGYGLQVPEVGWGGGVETEEEVGYGLVNPGELGEWKRGMWGSGGWVGGGGGR